MSVLRPNCCRVLSSRNKAFFSTENSYFRFFFFIFKGNFDETNLMNNVNNANNLNVDQLTGDFGQTVPVSAGTSGAVDNFNKNMTIARYNSKGMTHDDIMRISSQ